MESSRGAIGRRGDRRGGAEIHGNRASQVTLWWTYKHFGRLFSTETRMERGR